MDENGTVTFYLNKIDENGTVTFYEFLFSYGTF